MRTESGRWYNLDGILVESVPVKSRPGEVRKPTLADAKKLGLFPSATEICKLLPAPGLEGYKQKQLINAVMRTERMDGETEEDWIDRVLTASEEHMTEAAQGGSIIHGHIYEYIDNGKLTSTDEGLNAVILQVIGGLLEGKPHAEKPLVGGPGVFKYAGTPDLLLFHAPGFCHIYDFKTVDWKGKKRTPYDKWGVQLYLYKRLIESVHDVIVQDMVNIVIDRDFPSVETTYLFPWKGKKSDKCQKLAELLPEYWYVLSGMSDGHPLEVEKAA